MLTEIQKQRLLNLTTSQKFGKLIEDAIKTWSEKANVAFGIFGISKQQNFFTLDNNKCCCLIGAALLDKKRLVNEDYNHTVKRIYGIDYAFEIWSGFDDSGESDMDEKVENEYYKFGLMVREIFLDDNSDEGSGK